MFLLLLVFYINIFHLFYLHLRENLRKAKIIVKLRYFFALRNVIHSNIPKKLRNCIIKNH